ncbi:MAG: hypothetical protein OSA23_03705 [Rhodospirillales bacterium]|nr:hypothetical protein [Rhodospirillales bacterium]
MKINSAIAGNRKHPIHNCAHRALVGDFCIFHNRGLNIFAMQMCDLIGLGAGQFGWVAAAKWCMPGI